MTGRRTLIKSPFLGKVLSLGKLSKDPKTLRAHLRKKKIKLTTSSSLDDFNEKLIKDNYHAAIVRYRFNGSKVGARIVKKCRKYGVPCFIVGDDLSKEEVKEVTNLGAVRVFELPLRAQKLSSEVLKVWRDPQGLISRRERFFDLNMLTNKEKQIARLILKGLKNKEIAGVLNSTEPTIKVYSSRIYNKCEANNRADFFNLIFPT